MSNLDQIGVKLKCSGKLSMGITKLEELTLKFKKYVHNGRHYLS